MFLKYIYLENFRNISKAEIDFTEDNSKTIRKWTFLLGENGTGKSNILKAIGLITAGSDALGELLENVDQWIMYGKSRCIIRAIIVTGKNESRNLELIIDRKSSLSKVISYARESLFEIDKALAHSNRNYFTVAYGANRKLSGSSRSNFAGEMFHQPRSNSISTLFNRNATLFSLNEWAVGLDYRTDGKGISLIKDTLSDFLPDISFSHIDKKMKA